MKNIQVNISARGIALLIGVICFAVFFAGNYPDITIRSANSASVDGFGRFRVSMPVTLFDAQNEYSHSDLFWNTDLTLTADTNWAFNGEPVVDLVTGTTTQARVIRQTKEYFRYQSGNSLLIVMTVNPMGARSGKASTVGITKTWGYGDSLNGIFFQMQGDTMRVVKRSNTTGSIVDSIVTRTNWNVDTLGATTPSGYVPNLYNAQIWWIDIAWLGVSRVRMGVIDPLGNYITVHQWYNANNNRGTFMRTANLPVRYEIKTTAGIADTLRVICATVKSESGDNNLSGVNQSISLGVVGKTKTTIFTPIISIRLDTLAFNGIINRISLRDISLALTAASSVTQWQVVYNPTLTGPYAWRAMPTYSGSTQSKISGVQYDTSATGYSDGIVLASGYVSASGVGVNTTSGATASSLLSKIPLHNGIKGNTSVPLTIVVRGLTAAPTATNVILNWREIY